MADETKFKLDVKEDKLSSHNSGLEAPGTPIPDSVSLL